MSEKEDKVERAGSIQVKIDGAQSGQIAIGSGISQQQHIHTEKGENPPASDATETDGDSPAKERTVEPPQQARSEDAKVPAESGSRGKQEIGATDGSAVKILRVVVASPSDVLDERNAVEKAVAELNRGVALDRRLRLEVVRWETDAHPGFHPQGPQGLIDPILQIGSADIVIGIFWKRFGSPIKSGQSGTEHEIRSAIAARQRTGAPQVMVYFRSTAYAPRSREETDQWGKVLDFKRSFPSEGLWWEYDGLAEFEEALRNHLTNYVRTRFQISPS